MPGIVPQREDLAYPPLKKEVRRNEKAAVYFTRSNGAGGLFGLGGQVLGGERSGVTIRYQGRIFNDITVHEVSTNGVMLWCSEGQLTIPMNNVPPPIVSHYKREFQMVLAALPAALKEKQKTEDLKKLHPGYDTLNGTVLQVLENGVLARLSDKLVYIEVKSEGIVDGQFFRTGAYPKGVFAYSNAEGSRSTIERWVAVQPEK